jgi:two-component system, NarL family, nitrate/nitrite response regulator NarL
LQEPGERSLRHGVDVFVLVSVRLYRDGIADALGRDERFRVTGTAGTLDVALAQLRSSPRPVDVALVDLGLPEGAGATRALRADWPGTRIVAFAVEEADEDVVLWAEAGVAGLVSREASLGDLLDAVEAAARHEVLTSPGVTAALLRRVAAVAHEHRADRGPVLTRREREIVRLIGRGLSNKEIAGTLRIELPTVKNHVHNILEKLRVSGRAEAVSAARARGEIDAI